MILLLHSIEENISMKRSLLMVTVAILVPGLAFAAGDAAAGKAVYDKACKSCPELMELRIREWPRV